VNYCKRGLFLPGDEIHRETQTQFKINFKTKSSEIKKNSTQNELRLKIKFNFAGQQKNDSHSPTARQNFSNSVFKTTNISRRGFWLIRERITSSKLT